MRRGRRGAQSASRRTIQDACKELHFAVSEAPKPIGLYPVRTTQDLPHPLVYHVFAPEQVALVETRKRLMDSVCSSQFYQFFLKAGTDWFDEESGKLANSFADSLVNKQKTRFPPELHSVNALDKPKKHPKRDKDQTIGQVKTLKEEENSASSEAEGNEDLSSQSSVSVLPDSASEAAASESCLARLRPLPLSSDSSAPTTATHSPRPAEEFNPYMAESTLELGPIQNEVPEEHLQTLLDTLPPFQLHLFGSFQGVLRLFGAGTERQLAGKVQEKGPKRRRSSTKLVSPTKVAKKQEALLKSPPRKLQSSAELYATLGLLAKQ